MVARVNLSVEDRARIAALSEAIGVPSADQWTIARIALARSLQLAEPPEKKEYEPLPQQQDGVILHPPQLTGEGRSGGKDGTDYTDVYRALLSVYEGRDLFADDTAFHEALQRHVRRGLRVVGTEWREMDTLANYLAIEVLHGRHDDGTDAVEAASSDIPDRVMRILGELGVGATLNHVGNGPRLTRLTLELHDFDDLDRMRRSIEKIGFALGIGKDALGFELAGGERQVNLDIPRPHANWRTVGWEEVRDELHAPLAKALALPICVGTDILGGPLFLDLAAAPHLLVGGTTGSGKSMCLHALLLSLLEGPSGPVDLVLVDPKEVEFTAYENCRWLRRPVVRSAGEARDALEELVAEMDERQEIFRKLGVRDFAEAKAVGTAINRIVIVIDELSDLLMQDAEIETPLIRLAQKARSSGIHLVLATQRPEAATFSGLLRSNIPSRIALTVQKAAESRIILDQSGAEALLMRGDMLVKMSGEAVRRAHGCRVELADIRAGVSLA